MKVTITRDAERNVESISVDDAGLTQKLLDEVSALRQDIRKLGVSMSLGFQQLEQSIKALNKATTQQAAIIQTWKDRIAVDMSPEEVTQIQGEIDAATASLNAMGVNPADPVPVPVLAADPTPPTDAPPVETPAP